MEEGMKQIDILRKALSKKHPCNECHGALNDLEKLINDAPKFFSPLHDFDGEKITWLKDAGQIPE
jgi:hypothetical protein